MVQASANAIIEHWNQHQDNGNVLFILEKWSPQNSLTDFYEAKYISRKADDTPEPPSRKKNSKKCQEMKLKRNRKGKGKAKSQAKSVETINKENKGNFNLDVSTDGEDVEGDNHEKNLARR